MLLYALLHLSGYDLSMDELRSFRQWGSRTAGHPEYREIPGVETTTGPLGQGFSNGVGMALAEEILRRQFNRSGLPVFDHFTYAIVSDGDLMEGISHEAASLAGHLGLGRLVYLYDDNGTTIDGSTELTFSEDVTARFEAYRWQVLLVDDGNDLRAIDAAIARAKENVEQPSLIRVHTTIGYGSPNKAGTSGVHGSPLGPDEIELTRARLGWGYPPFEVPDEVYDRFAVGRDRGRAEYDAWKHVMERYADAHPGLARDLQDWLHGALPSALEESLASVDTTKTAATRASSGAVLNAISPVIPNLIGGSADLTGSNKTDIKGRPDFQAEPAGAGATYLRFGVREHGMAGICNGIALHGGLRPYCGTFLVFSDYLRPSLRLSALMRLQVTYVFSHDSIGLGEDGPTHQPVEHLMTLRATPNVTVIRPADVAETVEAWRAALANTDGPTAIALTRQSVPPVPVDPATSIGDASRGAYVVRDWAEGPELILIATGSEVSLAVSAAEILAARQIRVRVVSMPSWEIFEAQGTAYQRQVLPPEVRARVSIEAGVTLGWTRYLGDGGRAIGLDRFGESAPSEVLYERLGISVPQIVSAGLDLLGQEPLA
jgi:transketolase